MTPRTVSSTIVEVPPEPIPAELLAFFLDDAVPAPVSPACGGLDRGLSLAPTPPGAGWRKGASYQQDPLLYPVLRTDTFQAVKREIPGVGKVTREEAEWKHGHMLHVCGEPVTGRGHVGCSKDRAHWSRRFKHSCNNYECPVCWEHPVMIGARRISERLHGYVDSITGQKTLWSDLTSEDTDWHIRNAQNVRHIMLSPPPGLINIDTMSYEKIKEIGAKYAQRVGITGGVIFFHPWRIRKEYKPLLYARCKYGSKLSEDEREKKFWQAIREDVLRLGDWKKYVLFSPHYHVVGFGYVEFCKKGVASPDGWIVKVIRNVSTVRAFNDVEIKDPIVSLVAYILSHAMIEKGKKIPKWFGVCTSRNLIKGVSQGKVQYTCVCPKCGERIVYWQETLDGADYIKAIDEHGKEIPWVIKERQYRYEIKAGTRLRVVRNMIRLGCTVQRLPGDPLDDRSEAYA